MSLSTWEPFRRLDELDRLVDGLFAGTSARTADQDRSWRPAAEVISETDGYRIRLDLPGVGKDGVDVSMEREVLTIRGERKSGVGGEGVRRLSRSEVREGRFERAFRLPEDADGSEVNASYVDGVLEVRVPRRKQPQPRKIEVANT